MWERCGPIFQELTAEADVTCSKAQWTQPMVIMSSPSCVLVVNSFIYMLMGRWHSIDVRKRSSGWIRYDNYIHITQLDASGCIIWI